MYEVLCLIKYDGIGLFLSFYILFFILIYSLCPILKTSEHSSIQRVVFSYINLIYFVFDLY
jgi:hypothetical protein